MCIYLIRKYITKRKNIILIYYYVRFTDFYREYTHIYMAYTLHKQTGNKIIIIQSALGK